MMSIESPALSLSQATDLDVRRPGAPSLRVFLRKGGIPRTSILWDFDFLRSTTATGKGRGFYSCRKLSRRYRASDSEVRL